MFSDKRRSLKNTVRGMNTPRMSPGWTGMGEKFIFIDTIITFRWRSYECSMICVISNVSLYFKFWI